MAGGGNFSARLARTSGRGRRPRLHDSHVQESGPLEEGSGGAKSKRDVIMTEGDRARGCGKWLDESMFPQQNKVVASLSREA